MNIYKRIYEKVTITHNRDEINKSSQYLLNNGYRLIYSGPILKDMKVVPNKFKIVAEKKLDDFEMIREKK